MNEPLKLKIMILKISNSDKKRIRNIFQFQKRQDKPDSAFVVLKKQHKY